MSNPSWKLREDLERNARGMMEELSSLSKVYGIPLVAVMQLNLDAKTQGADYVYNLCAIPDKSTELINALSRLVERFFDSGMPSQRQQLLEDLWGVIEGRLTLKTEFEKDRADEAEPKTT